MNTILSFHKEPKVTLVGAGPGDAELITLKGIKALKTADVVLYDALVAPEILEFIPVQTPRLCVGKRAGQHSYTQDEINELIVDMAYLYGHVVRLKGGDPFVFGRGGEELEFAGRNGLKTAVIPGISSSLAVPASANIPVTMRGVSESFWVVTGTTMSGAISDDVALAARSTATVVILMGLNKLEEIVTIFSSHGKSQTPVAVIQNGTLENEKSVVGTVSTISDTARSSGIGAPAIIVIGEVVGYANGLNKLLKSAQAQVEVYQ
ncbi:MAG TPA: uroporphyrinogen-III C-methyltransferase [Chryseosolibacter sp.]